MLVGGYPLYFCVVYSAFMSTFGVMNQPPASCQRSAPTSFGTPTNVPATLLYRTPPYTFSPGRKRYTTSAAYWFHVRWAASVLAFPLACSRTPKTSRPWNLTKGLTCIAVTSLRNPGLISPDVNCADSAASVFSMT